MNTRTQNGFTLYELLTTVLVIGVVLMLGIPNMAAFSQNSRMTAASNDLHTTFHRARSDASRLRGIVTICSSTDGASCGGEFEDGWIVFQDTDGDITVDAGEVVLQTFPALDDDITVHSGGNDDYFSFAASGQGRGAVTGNPPVGTLLLCDSRGNIIGPGGRSTARVLVVTPLGRATVLSRKAQVDPAEAAMGGC